MRKVILSLPILRNYVKVSALLSLAAVVFLHPNNFAIGASLSFIVLYLGYLEGSYRELMFSIILGGILPTFGEMLAVHKGVWNYSNPNILGVPLWLPLAWGLASFSINRFVNRFVKKSKKLESISAQTQENIAA